MLQQRILVAVIALAALCVAPLAWGCEGTGMRDCGMSDCAMAMEPVAGDCHVSDALAEGDSTGCNSQPEMWIACCDAPVDPEPAKFDPGSTRDLGTTPLDLLVEQVEIEPPTGPPDSLAEIISTRQHEQGRFILLSSFLL